ncbi:MAG: hypothetical protein WAW41_02395 [Methylobacter sp.]
MHKITCRQSLHSIEKTPNETTIKAMQAAERGEHEEVSVDDLKSNGTIRESYCSKHRSLKMTN